MGGLRKFLDGGMKAQDFRGYVYVDYQVATPTALRGMYCVLR
jgi:hypothetical protein